MLLDPIRELLPAPCPVTPAASRRAAVLPWPLSLLGAGAAVPPRVIDNDYFVHELGLDTSDDWITSRTGIRQRRYATAGSTASELAVDAARQALDAAGMTAEQVELIVVATSTPDLTMPSTACLVQQRLGAGSAMAFDVVNACSGFVYALDAAARYLRTGIGTALVVGVDLGSRLIDVRDRGSCIFFGDGAGAVVASSSGTGRLLASSLHSEGSPAALHAPVGGSIVMDGRAVWDFATRVLPDTVRQLCDQAQVAVGDLRLLVPHQANWNILRQAAAELRLPLDRVAYNGDRYGNTLAASIPLALQEALAADRVVPGDLVVLVGFGAGLAWGGQLLRL